MCPGLIKKYLCNKRLRVAGKVRPLRKLFFRQKVSLKLLGGKFSQVRCKFIKDVFSPAKVLLINYLNVLRCFLQKHWGSHKSCSIKKAILKNFTIFTGKRLCCSRFLKATPAQVFSCKYSEIFQNTYFKEDLRTAASVDWKSKISKNRIEIV